MPPNIRRAYEKEQKQAGSITTADNAPKPLTDVVDMSPEMREIYERANREAQKTGSSRPLEDLPRTEDLYRRSAPADMQHLPSDESLYQPAPPVVDPLPPTIEPVEGIGMRGLMWGIVVALLLTGIAFVLSRLFL
jgi:hypothetical protein